MILETRNLSYTQLPTLQLNHIKCRCRWAYIQTSTNLIIHFLYEEILLLYYTIRITDQFVISYNDLHLYCCSSIDSVCDPALFYCFQLPTDTWWLPRGAKMSLSPFYILKRKDLCIWKCILLLFMLHIVEKLKYL